MTDKVIEAEEVAKVTPIHLLLAVVAMQLIDHFD